MQSFQELKANFKLLESLGYQEYLMAKSMIRLYALSSPFAIFWLSFFLMENKKGSLFFDPKEYSDQINFGIPSFEETLAGLIQEPTKTIQVPIVKIDSFYTLAKNLEHSLGWIDRLKNLLEENVSTQPFIEQNDPSLSVEQLNSINLFCENKWLLLLGGPGRGKTFTAKKICHHFLSQQEEAKLLVAAPTGKAAENLAKVIGTIDSKVKIEPKTLHALLEITPTHLLVDEDSPIEADLLIIDECSMIDFTLFSLLLKKIGQETKVLLIGDQDQLPPIYGFSPFKILPKLIPYLKNIAIQSLTIPFRTDQSSLLLLTEGIQEENLNKIELGLSTEIAKLFQPDEIKMHLKENILNFAIKKEHFKDEAQVYQHKIITSHNIGPYGAIELNEYAIEVLSKFKNRFDYLVPIIFIENDESMGIYNGKMALYSYFDSTPKIYRLNEKPLLAAVAPKFELGFSISIHKSQGSEFENVYVVLQEFNPLSKPLLYTAMSRAKKTLKIFGKKEDLVVDNKNDLSVENRYEKICLDWIEGSTLKHV